MKRLPQVALLLIILASAYALAGSQGTALDTGAIMNIGNHQSSLFSPNLSAQGEPISGQNGTATFLAQVNASKLPEASLTSPQTPQDNLTLLDPTAKTAANQPGYQPINKTVINDPAFQRHPPASNPANTYSTAQDPAPRQTTYSTTSVDINEIFENAINDSLDVSIGVSSTLIIQSGTGVMRVWDRTHLLTHKPQDLDLFRTFDGGRVADPFIFYDTQSCTWFASLLHVQNDEILLAASVPTLSGGCAGDITVNGVIFPTFNIFKISVGPSSNNCGDQPYLGNSDDKLTVTGQNICHNPQQGEFWLFKKSDLNSASPKPTPPNMRFGPDLRWSGIRPAREQGTTTQYLVTDRGGNFATLMTVTGDPDLGFQLGGPVATPTYPTISQVNDPPSAPQLGTNSLVDTVDSRVQSVIYQSGYLWFALNDGCIPQGDTQARSCIRLVGIFIGSTQTTVNTDFDFAGLATYFFYPALILDQSSHLFVVFGRSDSSTFPELRAIAGIQTSTFTFGTSQLIEAGMGSLGSSSPCQPCRYGDYFSAAADPLATNYVWLAGMIGPTSQASWLSKLAQVTYVAPLANSLPPPGIVAIFLIIAAAIQPIRRRTMRR